MKGGRSYIRPQIEKSDRLTVNLWTIHLLMPSELPKLCIRNKLVSLNDFIYMSCANQIAFLQPFNTNSVEHILRTGLLAINAPTNHICTTEKGIATKPK